MRSDLQFWCVVGWYASTVHMARGVKIRLENQGDRSSCELEITSPPRRGSRKAYYVQIDGLAIRPHSSRTYVVHELDAWTHTLLLARCDHPHVAHSIPLHD